MRELELTREVYKSLLPAGFPESDYFDVHAVSLPCHMVGGDYYDVLSLPDDRFGFALADVSGKGFPAAFTAARLQGIFAAVALGDPNLEDLFRRVNVIMSERTLTTSTYAVLFYGVLNRLGDFSWVNAGAPEALLVRADGSVDHLECNNMPLGLLAHVSFSAATLKLAEGDSLVVFSDGIIEARDTDGEEFGRARLVTLLSKCAGKSTEEICTRIMEAVTEFVGQAPQSDDISLLALRFGRPRSN